MSLLRRFAVYLSVTCGLTAIVTTAAWLVINDDRIFVADEARVFTGH